MELVKAGGRYIVKSSYEERSIPKSAGCRWDPEKKCWYTLDIGVASKMAQYASAEIKTELEQKDRERKENIEASRAANIDVEIPAPAGLTYLPYQRAGIAYAKQRPNTLIGDEMGLGKTIQAIGVSNADEEIKSVLIICPASLRLNWAREWKKWDIKNLSVGVANGTVPETDVVIINYDILGKHGKTLKSRQWDLLIADECHYAKNPKARRTIALLGKWDEDPAKAIQPIQAKRRLFLTGTPILNRPIELWPILNSIDPKGLGRSWKYFATRYCAASHSGYGWDVSGSSNLSELQERLRESVMVRRLKADVLTELPPKRRQIIELPVNGASNAVAAEQKAWAEQETTLAQLRINTELAKASGKEAYEEAVKALKEGAQTAFTEISKMRHETAIAKIPAVVEYLENMLEATDKIVVFAHHHDVINALMESFQDKAVKLTGETKLDERQAAVDRFQSDPTCKIFVGSIMAAGVGITLTAASTVVFCELDWVPGNISQAEDRCHRIGQLNMVNIFHLVLNESLDAKMARTLIEKQEVIEAALDKEIPEEPVLPEIIEPSTKRLTVKRVSEEAEKISSEEVYEIHHKLRFLAGSCDGALKKDGVGFNKYDAAIGHKLARGYRLTPKQAILGRVLVNKYRKQFEN